MLLFFIVELCVFFSLDLLFIYFFILMLLSIENKVQNTWKNTLE